MQIYASFPQTEYESFLVTAESRSTDQEYTDLENIAENTILDNKENRLVSLYFSEEISILPLANK